MSEQKKPLLKVEDLSDRLGISVATLYRWRSEGRDMPAGLKVGGQVRWTEESVEAWVSKRMEEDNA